MQPNLIKLYLMKRSVDSDVIMMAIRTMMTMITLMTMMTVMMVMMMMMMMMTMMMTMTMTIMMIVMMMTTQVKLGGCKVGLTIHHFGSVT